MPDLRKTLLAKLKEAEQLVSDIRILPKDSEESNYAIYRWAIVSDEATRLMLQAEELLSPAHLARLKANVNGDIWAKYRESEWRLPKFGAPGPGDEPPPMMPIRDFFE